MRFSHLIAAAMIAAAYALPATALTTRAGPPAPTEYPLPPELCDSPTDQVVRERDRCVPPTIDPRVIDGPVLPEHSGVACCRSDIILLPRE